MPWACANTATEYVPILFAVSPFAAIRSAPTITRSTLPCCIKYPAILSAINVTGIFSRRSSREVRRAPCNKGRVSSAYTWIFLPASCALRITPSAVPYSTVAKAPALQWVSMLAFSGTISLPCSCLLYTSDAADEEDSVDLGGRGIIKTKKTESSAGGFGQWRIELSFGTQI